MYRQSFEIFGYNAVGMAVCKVSLEVIGGSWNLVNATFVTVDPPHNDYVGDRREESTRSSFDSQDLSFCEDSLPGSPDQSHNRAFSSDSTSRRPAGTPQFL